MGKKPQTGETDSKPAPDFSPDEDYWCALGRFVETFARAENQVFLYLIHAIGVKKVIGKALFERQKCDELVSTLKRVWKVAPPPSLLHQELNDAADQMKAINVQRNTLVHSIAYVYPDSGRTKTNMLRAYSLDRIKEHPTSPEIVHDLCEDLVRIKDHFFTAWNSPDNSLAVRAKSCRSLVRPWRFKRPAGRPQN